MSNLHLSIACTLTKESGLFWKASTFLKDVDRVGDLARNRVGILTPKEEEALCFLHYIDKNNKVILDKDALLRFSGLKDGDRILICYCTEKEQEKYRNTSRRFRPLHPKCKYFS
jgi:hypothetical protein